jgi:hypothetical protein
MCAPIWTNSSTIRRRLFAFYWFSCTLAWVLGFLGGDYNFEKHFKPYFDIKNLNTYPHVNPSVYYAQQYMDAAVIEFVPGSHLDVSKSYGFKNGNVYCVAPIVGPEAPKDNFTGIGKDDYDFWAVGMNCCSGHRPDYHCGDYSNPRARNGLRLMPAEEHQYFKLAVQAAQAAHNIKAKQPMFMYWTEYPADEIHALVEDGWKHLTHWVFAFALFQLILTILCTCIRLP